MCRITGIIEKKVNDVCLSQMRDILSHGGPDDAGNYISSDQNIGLAHRRLSIIDLSAAGHQPMRFKNLVIVFNGEIYNFKEIAEELVKKGYTFSSQTDTEVILKAFDCWGYEGVERFRGMFAFAIWNETTEKLLLCRDRVGVKPLYWYLKDGLFMFASELKSFHKHPRFDKTINQEAVSLFLQTGYIRSPNCIFKNAHKVDPGSFLEIDLKFNIKHWKYWSARDTYLNASIREENETDLINECENILTESFKLRMVADVPVGMFLSGGIDSSLVTALLQKEYATRLKTFTIGFDDKNFNEAHYAKAIAKHIGTDHTELYCNQKHFHEIIYSLPDIYDEPFGDSSAIPTYLVSKLARESVTVSLSADGGDEIFSGYNRYLLSESLLSNILKIPKPLRNIASNIIENLSTNFVENISKVLPIPAYYKKNIDARLPKLAEILKAETPLDFLYSSTIFISKNALKQLHNFENNLFIFNKNIESKEGLQLSAFGVADIESYLEGDILTKVDRATMALALEGREPFLDHKVIEFALSLPDNLKIRKGETKWILRKILYKYVPKELTDRPKMGFGIPLDNWLSTLCKDELVEMANDKTFIDIFLLNHETLKKIVQLYSNKKGHSPYIIWYLYCLYKWYLRWM